MPVAGFCLDIAGVLTDNGHLLPGAQQALALISKAGLPCRLLTNTSRRPVADLHAELAQLGLPVAREHVLSAPKTLATCIRERALRPFLLIHPDIECEFQGIDRRQPNAVVICDAADALNYSNLDQAFALLLEGAPLLGVGMNRYFKGSHRLHLDAGPFIQALEFASGIKAEMIGKPGRAMFDVAVADMGLHAREVWMIGDDVDADIEGAHAAGLHACLVRTGKYREADENRLPPSARLEHDVLSAVSTILALR